MSDAFLPAWLRLVQELITLVDHALDVEPPGSCPAGWRTLLDAHGVAPLGEDDRLAEFKRERQSKGVPVRELAACVESLVARHQPGLLAAARSLPPERRRVVEQSITAFADHAVTGYRARATERKKGMFSHAKAAAALHRYGDGRGQGYVLTCSSCRAPRLDDALTCVFCGGALEATR